MSDNDDDQILGLTVLPAGWARGLVGAITVLLTLVLAMGDLASAWILVVLPLTVTALVAYAEVLERMSQSGISRPDATGPEQTD